MAAGVRLGDKKLLAFIDRFVLEIAPQILELKRYKPSLREKVISVRVDFLKLMQVFAQIVFLAQTKLVHDL